MKRHYGQPFHATRLFRLSSDSYLTQFLPFYLLFYCGRIGMPEAPMR